MTAKRDPLPRMAADVRPMVMGAAMSLDAWDSSTEEAAAAWIVLNEVKQRAEDKLKVLRERLMEEVGADGDVTAKSGYSLQIGEARFLKERRQEQLPNAELLRKVLEEAKVPADAAFTRQVSYVVDPSKLEALVATGKLKAEAVEECRKVS